MTERITVIEIKTDSDPFGGEYVQVSMGYKIPVPTPKNLPPNAIETDALESPKEAA